MEFLSEYETCNAPVWKSRRNPVEYRRAVFLKGVEEQIQLIEGILKGEEPPSARKAWWVNDQESILGSLKYSSQRIDLGGGRNCVRVNSLDELEEFYGKVKEFVIEGEMDSVLTQHWEQCGQNRRCTKESTV